MSAKRAAKRQSLYAVHPGLAMGQKWIAELKNKAGRSREDWIALVRKVRIGRVGGTDERVAAVNRRRR